MLSNKISKHTETMRSLASEIGFGFELKDDSGTRAFLESFKLFRHGISKKIHNIVRRRDPSTFEETLVFDYQYTISSGKSSRTFYQTVYMVYSKTFALPHFYMVPEKWYHQLGKVFGIDDIDFVAYPRFSKQYFLKGDDTEFIQHTFNQEKILDLFGREKGYSLEGCNYVFILYRHNKLLPIKQIREMIRVGEKVSHVFTLKGELWLANHKRILKEG